MAIQTVNIGTSPNDGTGDPARTAFTKLNANFTDSANAASKLVTTSATDGTVGRVLKVGDGGWMGQGGFTTTAYGYPTSIDDVTNQTKVIRADVFDNGITPSSAGIHFAAATTWGRLRVAHSSPKVWIQGGLTDNGSGWTAELRHTGNTTVDPNGFIKSASPIASLYSDRVESNGSAELEAMQFARIGTGHYRLTGVPELSREGWYIETPKDRNGNVYFTLDYEESPDTLDIYTYTPDYSTGRATNGAPVDILAGRFVSLRFAEAEPEPEAAE